MLRKITSLLLVLIMVLSVVGCSKKTSENNDDVPSDDIGTSTETPSTPVINPTINIELEELIPENPNGYASEYGHNNYSGVDYQNKPILTDNMVNTNQELIDGTDTYIYNDKQNSRLIVFSGKETVEVKDFKAVGTGINRIRDNKTGYLVGVYNTKEDYYEAMEGYTLASKILSGKTMVEKPTVIVNNQVLMDSTFYIKNGTYYLPLITICEKLNLKYEYIDSVGMEVCNYYGNEHYLPDRYLGNSMPQFQGYGTKADEFFHQSVIWWDNFKICQTIDDIYYADARALEKIYAVNIFVSDNIVYIVSDEYDIPQKFYIFDEQANKYKLAEEVLKTAN